MKRLTLVFICVVTGFSCGCATLNQPDQPPVAAVAAATPGNALGTEAAKPKPRLNPMPLSQQMSPSNTTPSGVQPFAVIKVDPTTEKLTGEMELRLQKVVEEARQDERTLFRLESFVPAGGSPGLDLGNSEKTLQYIKNRLVELGIPHRRILVSSFGAEHDLQRDPTRHWVEIYLIRTGTVSTSGTKR